MNGTLFKSRQFDIVNKSEMKLSNYSAAKPKFYQNISPETQLPIVEFRCNTLSTHALGQKREFRQPLEFIATNK